MKLKCIFEDETVNRPVHLICMLKGHF